MNRPQKEDRKKETRLSQAKFASLPSLSVHIKAISNEWWSADAGIHGCFDACNSNMEPLKKSTFLRASRGRHANRK